MSDDRLQRIRNGLTGLAVHCIQEEEKPERWAEDIGWLLEQVRVLTAERDDLRRQLEDEITISKNLRDAALKLEADCDALVKALQAIMGYIDNGTLVRDISKDGDRDWAGRMMKFVLDLRDAAQALVPYIPTPQGEAPKEPTKP